ncbi:hypothetical protein HDA40_000772 [Hamadaea flava]|uniref:DUF3995 domain-containing protein n=1 Tax=Hamadaea flava TaxID=1742688 RepID=A0ABV8LQ45_9ACTN|nr:hypothetical protein [Hamadaea flava]MCP2322265.1 hypothetical protein [Hamadaea flava]
MGRSDLHHEYSVMSIKSVPAPQAPIMVTSPQPPTRRWPALAAATYIGLFCVVAGAAVLWNMTHGTSWNDNGVVILAICLRMLTVALALASVQQWGGRIPSWMVLAGLWGCAAVQLVYPVAETVVKGLILTGAMHPIDKGISNMSPEGWFNFGATWGIWGVPGVLFLLAALSYRARNAVRARWILLGVVGGTALLGVLGALIG